MNNQSEEVQGTNAEARSLLSTWWHDKKPLLMLIITVVVGFGIGGALLVWPASIPSIFGGGVVLLIPVGLGWRLVIVQRERKLTSQKRQAKVQQARKNKLRDAHQDPGLDSKQNGSDPDDSYKESYSGDHWEEAYVAATNLFIAEGATIWGRHNFMAVLNGLIVAFIGIVLTSKPDEKELVYGAVVFGVILCLLWLQMMSRRWAYYDMYEETCREIEKACIPKGPQPFIIAERSRAKVRWKGRNLQGRHTILGQRTFSYWVIGLFFALYVFLAAWTCTSP